MMRFLSSMVGNLRHRILEHKGFTVASITCLIERKKLRDHRDQAHARRYLVREAPKGV